VIKSFRSLDFKIVGCSFIAKVLVGKIYRYNSYMNKDRNKRKLGYMPHLERGNRVTAFVTPGSRCVNK
jgi:hypothetical protein